MALYTFQLGILSSDNQNYIIVLLSGNLAGVNSNTRMVDIPALELASTASFYTTRITQAFTFGTVDSGNFRRLSTPTVYTRLNSSGSTVNITGWALCAGGSTTLGSSTGQLVCVENTPRSILSGLNFIQTVTLSRRHIVS